MIYLSIPKTPFAECLTILKQVEGAEIRLDLNDYSITEIKQIFGTDISTIATCRTGKYNDSERLLLLKTAICAGASIVDIEIEADGQYKKELIDLAHQHDCKVIISYHNFEQTPQKADLEQIYQDCFKCGADIAKLACYANSSEDAERMLDLYSSGLPITAIAMGENGKNSRIIAALCGAEISYAAISTDKTTADGQFVYTELYEIVKRMRDGEVV